MTQNPMERQEQLTQPLKQPQIKKYQIYSSPKLQTLTHLQINGQTLKLQHLKRDIDWKNVLAIDAYNQDKILVEVQLTLYSKQKKWFKGIVRCEEVIQFFILPDHVKQLLIDVRRWMTQTDIDKPKLLIFHNPISGSDSKTKLLKGIQFIKKTHFNFEVVTTQYKNHCKDYLKQNKPTQKEYWGVAIFSGDGLVHQYINSGCTLPVIHLPAGSGNAFAKSQADLAHQECSIETNLFVAMKGLTTKISLLQVDLEKEPDSLYSTLNIEWAFLADVDMESQFLRCLGTFRFQVMSVWRYISLRNYYGRVTYSETSVDLPDLKDAITNPQFKTIETDIYQFLVQILPYAGQKYKCAPLIDVNSQVMDLQTVTRENGKYTFLKYLLNFESGGNFDLQNKKCKLNIEHHLIKSFRLQPMGQRKGRIGIDGEEYEAQNIQARVIPQALNVFTLY